MLSFAKSKSIPKKIMILVLAIILVEIILRFLGLGQPPVVLLDNEIEYYLKPNENYLRFGNIISINKYGMRSDDLDLTPPLTFPHTVIFGDSVVYGNHFIDQSETISSNLQKILGDKNIVSAVAASSWGPGNIKAFIQNKTPFLTGKTAIIIQSTHDIYDIPFVSSDIIPYRISKSTGAIGDAIQIIIERIIRKISNNPLKNTITAEEAKNSSNQALKWIIDYTKENFEEVILFHHATIPEIETNNKEGAEYYKKLAQEKNIQFISSSQYYIHHKPKTLYQDHIHLNYNGTKFVAQLLKENMN